MIIFIFEYIFIVLSFLLQFKADPPPDMGELNEGSILSKHFKNILKKNMTI